MQDENEKGAKERKELKETVKAMEAKNKEMEARLEAKDKEMERRLHELEDNMRREKDEFEKRERRLEASVSKLRSEVEESLRKEMASNYSKNALTKPSTRDLPIVIISAWRATPIESPQTVTFESFLANYNNGDRPGGGSGELDLDSGVFTCFTPGYYTVSFTAYGQVGPHHIPQDLFLYKNGAKLSESRWFIATNHALNDQVGVTGSRILVSRLLEMFG